MNAAQQTGTGVRTGSQSRVATSGIKALVLAAVAAGAIIAASAFLGVVPLGSSGGLVLSAEDHSYDAIENARSGGLVLSAEDHSYDAIEKARGGGLVLSAEDHSYDAIEKARGASAS